MVELLIAMGIFISVIIITTSSFDRILSRAGQETKTAESQIEGVVGLEVLRRDVAEAGFGLPWNIAGVSFTEVTTDSGDPAPGVDAKEYNNNSAAPVAVQSGNNLGFNGSDYLVVKSTSTGMSATAKKWYTPTFTNYTSRKFSAGERLTVLRNTYAGGVITNKILAATSSGSFTLSYPAPSATFPSAFRPDQMLQTFMAYGVAPPPESAANTPLRMPFNRSDYYIKRPGAANTIPETCAKPLDPSDNTEGVGILYRSTASQIAGEGGGGYSPPFPLLDCVADMQVVYVLDTDGDGVLDLRSNTIPAPNSGIGEDKATAVRNQVRAVRIYILAQEGGRSSGSSAPDKILVGERAGNTIYGKEFIFGDQNIKDWNKYNWRVYTVVVPMANLN